LFALLFGFFFFLLT